MSAFLWNAATTNGFATTLNGSITDDDASITLTTVTGLQAPGVLVIDRQNSDEEDTPNTREYITFTGISTNTLTGCTRGVAGSTAQAHASGANVEETMSISHWNDMVEFLQASHNASGNIVTSTATIGTVRVEDNVIFTGEADATPTAAGQLTYDTTSKTFKYGDGSQTKEIGIAGSGTGGLNALLQIPSSLPTSATDVMGGIPIPTTFTGQFITMTLRTPSSQASTFVTLKKYPNTVYGVIAMPAGATFASSGSISSPTLVAGDEIIGDINSSAWASDLKVLLRAT